MTGGGEDGLPQHLTGIEPFAGRNRQRNRDVGEVLLPVTDEHVGPTRHSCVHGGLSQQKTEPSILGVRPLAADDVAGIDELQVEFSTGPLEVGLGLGGEEGSDIGVANIARRIARRCVGFCCDQVLACGPSP